MTDKKQDAHAELMDLADWHAEDRVRAGQSPKTYISREALSDFARAIERAHGIDGIKAHQGGAA